MDTKSVKQILFQFLPDHDITYCDVEENEIFGVRFKNAGVAVTLKSGLEIFGSSANSQISPLMNATYELLERYSILKQPREPSPYENESFKYSLSNGVAIHNTFEDARSNAYFELLERNEILKSWYFNTPIKLLSLHSLSDLTQEIREIYDFIVADFSTIEGTFVIGVFAFPKIKEANLIYGFGGHHSSEKAVAKAWKEFVARMGFLWGEEPSLESYPINTPDYHQDFYLKSENSEYIKEWLFGTKFPKEKTAYFQLKDVYYVNITPIGWESDFSVVKARSKDSIPLFFGQPPKQLFDFPYRYDIPHPIM